MLNKLYELNPFFEISVNNITVLCNLDNAFAFRCSDIMNEFKTLYPEHCIDEIENILVKKYAGTVVKRFLKKLELYHSVLFRENLKSPFFYEKYFTTLTLNVLMTIFFKVEGKYQPFVNNIQVKRNYYPHQKKEEN